MMRAYAFHGFPPVEGLDAFELVVAQRRELWAELAEVHTTAERRRAALIAADPAIRASGGDDKARRAALKSLRESSAWAKISTARTDGFRLAKQRAAAAGLHWGSYNDAVSMFEGAVAANRHVGATPGHEGQRGERATIQFQRGLRPTALNAGGEAVSLTRVEPPPNRQGHQRGKKRGKRPEYRCAFALRTDRNPLGAAALVLNVIGERPLPPGAIIKMAHIDRLWKPIIRKNGEAGRKAYWRLTLVAEVTPGVHFGTESAGVALTWRGGDDDDEMTYAVVARKDGRAISHVLPVGWAKDWQAAKALRDEAQASGDAADIAAAEISMARLLRRRIAFIREFCADIARRYPVVGVQKMTLAGKGVKGHAAPAAILRELKRAVENAGGTLVNISIARDALEGTGETNENLARTLAKMAEEEILSGDDDENGEANQCVA